MEKFFHQSRETGSLAGLIRLGECVWGEEERGHCGAFWIDKFWEAEVQKL